MALAQWLIWSASLLRLAQLSGCWHHALLRCAMIAACRAALLICAAPGAVAWLAACSAALRLALVADSLLCPAVLCCAVLAMATGIMLCIAQYCGRYELMTRAAGACQPCCQILHRRCCTRHIMFCLQSKCSLVTYCVKPEVPICNPVLNNRVADNPSESCHCHCCLRSREGVEQHGVRQVDCCAAARDVWGPQQSCQIDRVIGETVRALQDNVAGSE
jgi:hypothetical protein